jgi:hypothetical protein
MYNAAGAVAVWSPAVDPSQVAMNTPRMWYIAGRSSTLEVSKKSWTNASLDTGPGSPSRESAKGHRMNQWRWSDQAHQNTVTGRLSQPPAPDGISVRATRHQGGPSNGFSPSQITIANCQ